MRYDARTFFDPQGPLAQKQDWFDPRAEQRAMALAVERALSGKRHLFVEAGTGVGKSLAYLIPAAVWAIQNKKRVLIATHTKALQEQLIAKDLPRVQTILKESGLDLNYALLMGSENYLCVQRLHQAKTLQKDLFGKPDEADILEDLLTWAKTASTGLRRALPHTVSQDLWSKIARDRDLCLGRRGPFWEQCLFRKDWQRARQAQILVVNHSLFFAGNLQADAVIFDEAHNLPDVASRFLGLLLTSRAVERLLHDLHNPASGKGLVTRLKRAGRWKESMQQTIAAAFGASHRFFEDVRVTLNLNPGDGMNGELASRRILKPLAIADEFSPTLAAITSLLNDALAETSDLEEETEIKAHMGRCQEKMTSIHDFLECRKPDFAWWAELVRQRSHVGIELHAAPLDISSYFRESVFKAYSSVILTSATLTANGSFQLLTSQLGGKGADETLLASPFRYDRQAGLYAARDIPDPRADPDAFEAAVFERCQQLIPLIPGGIFILFTSWGMLNRFMQKISITDRNLFKQGSEVPGKLVEAFKKDGRGILLGTATFWEGVDVPGSALSGVIITKLPFLSPESPYEDAKQEWLAARGVDVFNDYLLPKAVVKFRQGFGRLIRSRTDHGLVAVLDPRLASKRYGQVFRRSLPACQLLPDLQHIPAFFKKVRAVSAKS